MVFGHLTVGDVPEPTAMAGRGLTPPKCSRVIPAGADSRKPLQAKQYASELLESLDAAEAASRSWQPAL